MSVWIGDEVAKFIREISDESIQPNGVDLTVFKVYKLSTTGVLARKSREIPPYIEIPPRDNRWHLSPGAYVIRYSEYITIPENAVGIVLPRSSLLRMGATIYSALWDSGYEGRGIGLLSVFNPSGIILERGARIAQMIFISAKRGKKYSGIWKGEDDK